MTAHAGGRQVTLTMFESRVLRRIADGKPISGAGMVHFMAAARRLEAKGLASKGVRWRITEDGRRHLSAPARPDPAACEEPS